MLTFHAGQEQELQSRYYQQYLDEFNAFLKANYPDTAALDDVERRRLIDVYHGSARKLRMDDYRRINTFIICCFLFGEEAITSDPKLVGLFRKAEYETEGMVNYVNRRLKMREYAQD